MSNVSADAGLEQSIFKTCQNRLIRTNVKKHTARVVQNCLLEFILDIMMEFYLLIGERSRVDGKWAALFIVMSIN